MCGITGIFNYGAPDRPVDRDLLERMTGALAHRGPDGEGFHVEGPIGLGHRRLAIVDLSPTGAQPMPNEDGSAWISYNGEFYDHLLHRPSLASRHQFRGTSDTETLLCLLHQRGPDALAEISAIFGLAYWDARRRTLVLARDPLGVKQVYFYDDGERLLFASEIKALLVCSSIAREIDVEAVNQYLHFHTPLFDRTFFRGIRQLRPGEYLELAVGGRRNQRRYWQVSDFDTRSGSPEESLSFIREQIAQVVRDQLMADVPVGAFFSGGIDSSAVAAFAKRAGTPPRCFGVHFAGQGVIDERPFQESAARAIGLDLELTTLDGGSFPDDLERLMFHQDEPVIGAAMLPMYYVSRLASQRVKVCLGGQAADEIFGGYARYTLAHPWRAAASLAFSRRASSGLGSPASSVGGNLKRQAADPLIWGRLARNAHNLFSWRELYFQNFAKVPEAIWTDVFAADGLVSRENCRQIFYETLAASPASDSASKVMHWDLQAYLPGLFQQDDRMSMANGLESRVPLADPRLVRAAFQIPFHLKVRDGATKWILRQAVADVLPSEVLTRRKVGFDTPADHWMKHVHAGFVRETLLSSRARQRGLWDVRALSAWLDQPEHHLWFDVVWKVLCIEQWARSFLDTKPVVGTEGAHAIPSVASRAGDAGHEKVSIADRIQELREMGTAGTVFRARWELSLRSGLKEKLEKVPPPLDEQLLPSTGELVRRLPFADPPRVVASMADRVDEDARKRLLRDAVHSAQGRITCFGRWIGDYGNPIDWHLNPVSGRRWNPKLHWTRVLEDEPRGGDVKLTWEIGRFPHAYRMARAAAFHPASLDTLAEALAAQLESFVRENPRGLGVHWASGQELVLRLIAWLFALAVMGEKSPLGREGPLIGRALYEAAVHIENYFEYTRLAVYNNHLISEALGLLLAGILLPQASAAQRWRSTGLSILTEQADRQFYSDGGYIQQSHNYHRVAIQLYLWAAALLQKNGEPVPRPWLTALERSLQFLVAQQNPADGRLPNYGSNDGAYPCILATTDFSDFRPTLQAVSLLTRNVRLYAPGPWDEFPAWLLGPESLDAPLRPPVARSVSFNDSGYHVLRGHDSGSFGAFRCGTLKDRFSQMDMLSLDVWSRGENVLVDAGSYLYNGQQSWHAHFVGTSSHNTVTLDGRNQMLHLRRFKSVYWTSAKMISFRDEGSFVVCEGEHYGYRRHAGRAVHRRAILFAKDELWVVVDRIVGTGSHEVRLQWLGGAYPFERDAESCTLTLTTPAGLFTVSVFDATGRPARGDVEAGAADPPRGWVSRYYGEKARAPSLVVKGTSPLPVTLVTVMSPARPQVRVEGAVWTVEAGSLRTEFRLDDGRFADISVVQSCCDCEVPS